MHCKICGQAYCDIHSRGYDSSDESKGMDCKICGQAYCDIHSRGYDRSDESQEEEEEEEEERLSEVEVARPQCISKHIDISGKWINCFDTKGFTITVVPVPSKDAAEEKDEAAADLRILKELT